MKTVSIITVCKNSQTYISDCINSVIKQDSDDYEYIVIDGKSTDGTVDIIKEYEKYIDYWCSEKDENIAEAFNKGLSKARGQWILFLNSDDYLCSRKTISNTIPILEQRKGMDLVFGKIKQVKVEDNIQVIVREVGSRWQWEKYRYLSTLPHPACFTNRDYFSSFGDFDQNYTNALDYEIFLRKGKNLKTYFIDSVLTHMRLGGMSNQYAFESLRQSMYAQIKNKALPSIVAYTNWAYLVTRLNMKNVYSKSLEIIEWK